ncbi:MAG: hypothetical protein IKG14_05605 [Clostridia bacterium]|nr:hypothetical protein [Clostridia bacterium]
MSSELISFLVGYAILVNLIGIILIWLKQNTEFIKIPKKVMNTICIVLSIIGGFVGVLVGAEMLGYEQDNKLFKRWIPFFIFIEGCIIIYIVYQNIK